MAATGEIKNVAARWGVRLGVSAAMVLVVADAVAVGCLVAVERSRGASLALLNPGFIAIMANALPVVIGAMGIYFSEMGLSNAVSQGERRRAKQGLIVSVIVAAAAIASAVFLLSVAQHWPGNG